MNRPLTLTSECHLFDHKSFKLVARMGQFVKAGNSSGIQIPLAMLKKANICHSNAIPKWVWMPRLRLKKSRTSRAGTPYVAPTSRVQAEKL